MVVRNFLVLVVLVFTISNLFGQNESQKAARREAYDALKSLKSGYLLIRVENYGNAIEALEKRGQYSQANKLEEEAHLIEEEYLKEIPKNYNFSKFLFFYSSDADKLIKENDFSVLFDENKAKISDLNMDPDGLFICTKERKSYTILSLRLDFHVFKLANNRINRLAKPFPTEMNTPPPRPRIAFWKQLVFEDEVMYMNDTLNEYLNKLD